MKHPDPTVTIAAWSGPLSALSARLGIAPPQLAMLLKHNARWIHGEFVLDAPRNRTMTLARCLLTRLPEGAKEPL